MRAMVPRTRAAISPASHYLRVKDRVLFERREPLELLRHDRHQRMDDTRLTQIISVSRSVGKLIDGTDGVQSSVRHVSISASGGRGCQR